MTADEIKALPADPHAAAALALAKAYSNHLHACETGSPGEHWSDVVTAIRAFREEEEKRKPCDGCRRRSTETEDHNCVEEEL